MRIREGAQTPWGTAQTVETLAEGITLVTTAGHGGIHLSAERYEEMHPALRKVDARYCPPNWYEEDCEAALVVLAFPDLPCFKGREDVARRVVQDYYPERYAAWEASR